MTPPLVTFSSSAIPVHRAHIGTIMEARVAGEVQSLERCWWRIWTAPIHTRIFNRSSLCSRNSCPPLTSPRTSFFTLATTFYNPILQPQLHSLHSFLTCRLDCHLVGGFLDEGRSSEDLSRDILAGLATSQLPFRLRSALISRLNNLPRGLVFAVCCPKSTQSCSDFQRTVTGLNITE